MINSNKLKGRMKEKGVTQAALAKYLKISQPTCCQKLNNTRQLTLDEANGICEILDISPEHFGSYFFIQQVAKRNISAIVPGAGNNIKKLNKNMTD